MNTDDFKRAATFTGLAFVVSWALYFGLRPLVPVEWGLVVHVAFMFGPFIAALLTAARFDRGRIVEMLALKPRVNLWWLVAWLAPLAIVGGAWAIALLLPGVAARPFTVGMAEAMTEPGTQVDAATVAALPHPLLVVVQAAILGGLVNTIAAIGEEAGWRGYLWTVLRPWGFWKTTLAVGTIWGLWHAPLIAAGHNYGVGYMWWPWMGITMMTLFTIALSPLMGLLRERTGTSWAPALCHGTINAVGGLVMLGLVGHPLVASVAGLAGVIVLSLVAAAVALTISERRPA